MQNTSFLFGFLSLLVELIADESLVRLAIFGEADLVNLQLCELFRQPQGHCTGDLDFHQTLVGRDDLRTVARLCKCEVVAAFGDLAVKGQAEIMVVLSEERASLVADVLLGGNGVVAEKNIQLGEDLFLYVLIHTDGLFVLEHVRVGFCERHGHAAFGDDAADLFLDLQKDLIVGACGGIVAAQADLLFIKGLGDGFADKVVIGGVVVDIVDAVVPAADAVFVRLHVLVDLLKQGFILFEGEQEFDLFSLKCTDRHTRPPFCTAVFDIPIIAQKA